MPNSGLNPILSGSSVDGGVALDLAEYTLVQHPDTDDIATPLVTITLPALASFP